ncbi:MAG: polyprenyl synthetase family protein [Victivallaceae bacterium]|nr:polyprenyl synthetase family protein [Victivallaceae bacterium]
MKASLKKIAGLIDQLIRTDNFPQTIKPDYLREAVIDYPVRGGKRLRPALMAWCCEAASGDPAATLHAAAAVEVFHNWTLVHDDIIDRDLTRRGAPTCHKALAAKLGEKFKLNAADAERAGADFAILAGDLQQAWASELLLKSVQDGVSTPIVAALLANMHKLADNELISGEALDVEFSLRPADTITIAEVERMIYLKTGALLRFAAESGAMIGSGDPDPAAPLTATLGRFASLAGMSFQLRDDFLGIFGATEFGKPIGSDLREGKATIILAETLKRANASDRAVMLGLLRRDAYSQADVEEARRIMIESGAAASVERRIADLGDECRTLLMTIPNGDGRRKLLEFNDYLAERTI